MSTDYGSIQVKQRDSRQIHFQTGKLQKDQKVAGTSYDYSPSRELPESHTLRLKSTSRTTKRFTTNKSTVYLECFDSSSVSHEIRTEDSGYMILFKVLDTFTESQYSVIVPEHFRTTSKQTEIVVTNSFFKIFDQNNYNELSLLS